MSLQVILLSYLLCVILASLKPTKAKNEYVSTSKTILVENVSEKCTYTVFFPFLALILNINHAKLQC